MNPLLIIGIGGSGGKTVRAMKQALVRSLESARYEGGLPKAWQFLQIDTTHDGVQFPAPMLPSEEVHLVVPSGATFESVRDSITNRGTLEEQQKMMTGWGIPYSDIAISQGAGMMRGIGRQVGIADSTATLNALQNSISKMIDATAMPELASVAKALGQKIPSDKPQAFIISSLAGGSGAGMFIDVAELLKRTSGKDWTEEAISLLYTAEVFDSLGAAGANVSKNSLGAMNELIASKWVGISDRSELLYSKLGLVAGGNVGKSGYGCKGNILVGARNKSGIDISKGADGEGMDEVFLTIGEALAGALTNDAITEFLYQRAFVNITQMKSAIDVSGLAPSNPINGTLSAAGIGFGQMSLGADRIVEYVGDALTRKQVEKLLWPELSVEELKAGNSMKAIIQSKADQIWPNFLLESGLDEKGKQNQIIDELLPKSYKENNKRFVSGLVAKNVSATAVPLKRFSKAVWTSWDEQASKFLTSAKDEVNALAEAWVPTIQERLREQFAKEIMENGYAVVTNLAQRLAEEMKGSVLPDVRKDYGDFSRAVSGFNENSFDTRLNEIAGGLTGVSTQNGQFIEKLVTDFERVLDFQIQAHVNSLVESLVEDMLSYFFEPLIQALADARFALAKQQKSQILPNGSKNPYNSFPEWASKIVPGRYKPRTIERILIDIDEYESTYEFFASRDSAGSQPFQQSVSAALLGKKMNPMPGDKNDQTLISSTSPWITSVREAKGAMGASVTKLQWTFHTDMFELSDRNRRWLKNEDSTFGKFTNMSIRDFVNAPGEDPAVRAKREEKFVKEYTAMLGLAQPLILINENSTRFVLSVKEDKADGIMLESSKIPFAKSSNVGILCTKALKAIGENDQDKSFELKWFDPSSMETTMYAASTTQASLPAWAFASLTEPILKQVATSKNDADVWIQFWEGRRTRPLIEAIPFETELRRSMITGWFIASLFGLRKIEGVESGRTVQIWNPNLQVPGWSRFPSPLLASHFEDTKRETWVLPALFTSAGIALSEFGKTGNKEAIHGYQLLKFLGREVTTQMRNRDQWDANGQGDEIPTGIRAKSDFIKKWVTTGELPAGMPPLDKLLQVNLSGQPDRGSALVAALEASRDQYQKVWQEFAAVVWHKLPETWELKDDIDMAFGDIINYVNDIHVTTSTTNI